FRELRGLLDLVFSLQFREVAGRSSHLQGGQWRQRDVFLNGQQAHFTLYWIEHLMSACAGILRTELHWESLRRYRPYMGCHPERSEGSASCGELQIPRSARDGNP